MNLPRLYRRQKLRTRLILAFMLTVLIPLVGTSLYGNWITSQILQSQAVEVAEADLRMRHLQMEESLQGSEENLLFLSQMNSMATLLKGRSSENLARAQVDFADFVSTHPDVFQARYLDESGMEVVRIDAGFVYDTDGWLPVRDHDIRGGSCFAARVQRHVCGRAPLSRTLDLRSIARRRGWSKVPVLRSPTVC